MKSAKICIIGGGIAGLASAIFLKRAGFQVSIYERASNIGHGGYAFLLLANGLDILNKAGLINKIYENGDEIKQLILNDETNIPIDARLLSDAVSIRRTMLCSILHGAISSDLLKVEHQFTHFVRDETGKATHACFANGNKAEADIFIGADGTRSLVRSEIDSTYELPPIEVKELVSYVKIAPPLRNTLVKFQHKHGSLAAGYIPMGSDGVNWYMQFNAKYWELYYSKDKKRFAKDLIGYFPEPFPKFIELTDFNNSHLWNTTNMIILPKFYDKNIVIIGDAAHTFSPFSSQGVNTALEDAFIFSEVISKSSNLQESLETYSAMRIPSINSFMQSGKEMVKKFLSAEQKAFIPLAM